MRGWKLRGAFVTIAGLVVWLAPVQTASAAVPMHVDCGDSPLCTEVSDPSAFSYYVGHDEPSLLFYSNKPGSGNNNHYLLRLPKDPPQLPNQAGTGATWNFQLHPAFWFGMALCDTQSAPNPGPNPAACKPNSDTNIFDSSNPNAADYIGKHPGTAFMEMQFYPPGWVAWPPGNSCDATKWCAAMNIDSLSQNYNTGEVNNSACLAVAGIEPVNFAFITKSGAVQAPANPVNSTLATFTPDPNKDLFMNSGDLLSVDMFDTAAGFRVVIKDRTTGQKGSMTASGANTFGQTKFDPNATTCTNIPYNFHPMYSTTSEHTRVPWAAHSYNVAFADEIGHFEYCNAADPNTGNCTTAGASDPGGIDSDDAFCHNANESTLVQIAGCQGTDVDFDGPEYGNNWPGTLANTKLDRQLHAQPVTFSSPTFGDGGQYDRVAFEADLPRIEFATNPPCQRHISNPADPNPGQGCVNPPVGASFYPIFTTSGGQNESSGDNSQSSGDQNGQCMWQLGGAFIPGTANTFGGTSTAEYGPLLVLAYPNSNNAPTIRYNNFRQILSNNPCRTDS